MKLQLFTLATILALGQAGEGRGAGSPTDAQCEAAIFCAEVFAARFPGRRLVFDSSSFWFMELPRADRQWAAVEDDRRVPGPPAALVQSMTDTNALNVCAVMRARLAAMRIPYGRAAVRRATHHRRNGPFRAVILTLSLPAVSADGQHAVLGESSFFGPMDGGAGLVHLQRNAAGRWEIASSTGLYVS